MNRRKQNKRRRARQRTRHQPVEAAPAAEPDTGPTHWKQDLRVAALTTLLLVASGLVALLGWLYGTWLGLAFAAGVIAFALYQWRKAHGRILPRDVTAGTLFGFAVVLFVLGATVYGQLS